MSPVRLLVISVFEFDLKLMLYLFLSTQACRSHANKGVKLDIRVDLTMATTTKPKAQIDKVEGVQRPKLAAERKTEDENQVPVLESECPDDTLITFASLSGG